MDVMRCVAAKLGLALVALTAVTAEVVAEDCSRNAESNMRRFEIVLKAMHPNSGTTARSLQDQVEYLCRTGTSEIDAYRSILTVLGVKSER